MAGKEAVLVYVSDLVASITPPVKRLRAFDKIALEAGASQTVSFEIPVQDLAFVGRNNQWILEPGTFKVRVGGLDADFELVNQKAAFEVKKGK